VGTFKTGGGELLEFDDASHNKGGEGAVYKQYDRDGHGDIGDLAKVFHAGKDTNKEEKIKAMLVLGSPTPSYSYTWPKDILYDANTGEFRGYSMYLKDGKKEVADICRDSSTFRKDKNWLFFVHTAKNLAQAVAGVHAKNQVIGDLNAKNILVSPNDAQVTLIDTDSFHITVGDKKNPTTHRCNVGIGEFIAPEIQGIRFSDAPLPTFTEQTDNFSLAVIIFKLLLNGLHPFYNPDGSSLEDNMRHGVSTALVKPKKRGIF
jgi:DNA-binding helix-hairpin-helix protein with protein kinase domain